MGIARCGAYRGGDLVARQMPEQRKALEELSAPAGLGGNGSKKGRTLLDRIMSCFGSHNPANGIAYAVKNAVPLALFIFCCVRLLSVDATSDRRRALYGGRNFSKSTHIKKETLFARELIAVHTNCDVKRNCRGPFSETLAAAMTCNRNGDMYCVRLARGPEESIATASFNRPTRRACGLLFCVGVEQ